MPAGQERMKREAYQMKEMQERPSLSSRLWLKGVALFQKYMAKKYGLEIPENGRDLYDVIKLDPGEAAAGGKVGYHYLKGTMPRDLLVKVPAGVRDGQKIRLKGLGEEGKNGGVSGDLYLKVNIRVPIFKRIVEFFKQG
jgi:curved DNA-binding protein CbpA